MTCERCAWLIPFRGTPPEGFAAFRGLCGLAMVSPGTDAPVGIQGHGCSAKLFDPEGPTFPETVSDAPVEMFTRGEQIAEAARLATRLLTVDDALKALRKARMKHGGDRPAAEALGVSHALFIETAGRRMPFGDKLLEALFGPAPDLFSIPSGSKAA